jgi:protein transport protein YIF1
MSIFTYVLLVGLVNGIRNKFTPDILGRVATKAFIFIFIELFIVKLGSYLLNITTEISLFDTMAIIGYNYVALILSIVSDLIFGRIGKYVMFTYTSVAMAFFLLRSLKHAIIAGSNEFNGVGIASDTKRRRVNFLFVIVAAQMFSLFFLLV